MRNVSNGEKSSSVMALAGFAASLSGIKFDAKSRSIMHTMLPIHTNNQARPSMAATTFLKYNPMGSCSSAFKGKISINTARGGVV